MRPFAPETSCSGAGWDATDSHQRLLRAVLQAARRPPPVQATVAVKAVPSRIETGTAGYVREYLGKVPRDSPSWRRDGCWPARIDQTADAAGRSIASAGALLVKRRSGIACRGRSQRIDRAKLYRMRRTSRGGEEDRDRYRDTAIADQCTQKTDHVVLQIKGIRQSRVRPRSGPPASTAPASCR